MSNISYRVSKTRLFKERESLGIEFCWETADEVVFSKTEYDLDILGEYYLIESFSTGVISVTEEATPHPNPNRLIQTYIFQ